MIVLRYVTRHFLVAFTLSLAGMCALFLIIDFADRAKFYGGRGWVTAVLELYACKLAVVAYQLAPAACALGGAVSVSALRRTGEATALASLGRGPSVYALPFTLLGLAVGLTMLVLEDPVVVRANFRAEEITALRFQRWVDWSSYQSNRRWFHGANGRVYFLGRLDGEGFASVAIYDLDAAFRVRRRLDAAKVVPAGEGEWRLTDTVLREFPEGAPMRETRAAERVERFAEDLQSFRVKTGRPSHVRRRELPGQAALRRKLGLPSLEWELAWYERLAQPFAGAPAAILGAMLALRPRRVGHLSMALGEGFVVTLGLWLSGVLARALVMAGHLAPFAGGVAALVVTSLVAAWVVRARS